MEKVHGVTEEGIFWFLLVESHGTCLILPAKMCDNAYEMLATREAG